MMVRYAGQALMTVVKTQDKMTESINLVQELLEKQKLVEGVVHHTDTPRHDLVEALVHRQHLAELHTKLNKLHTADLAHVIEILPTEDRMRVWQQVQRQHGGEILLEVSDSVLKHLVDSLSPEELDNTLKQLDGDDLAYIADLLPKEALQSRLETLSSNERQWLHESLHYDEDTVGYLMGSEMVTVRDDESLEQVARTLRSRTSLPGHTDKLFVINRRGLLVGILSLQNILLHEPDKHVHEVMASEIVEFLPEDDAGAAAKAFERYDLISAPVVNGRGKLIGRLTVDVVMDYLREQATDDVLGMAGVSAEEDLYSSSWESAKNRAQWMIINLFTAFIASRVIGLFSDTIAQLVALAALMPIVASIGGNTGNQTVALIIRALSLGQITSKNARHLVRREIGVSLIIGIGMGAMAGLFAFVLYHDPRLSAVIGIAMLLTIMLAAVVGLAVPILLEKAKRDPALGSSIILTATTDSMGFFIFLGLATLFLK